MGNKRSYHGSGIGVTHTLLQGYIFKANKANFTGRHTVIIDLAPSVYTQGTKLIRYWVKYNTLQDIGDPCTQVAMPSGIHPNDQKPLKADTSRWHHFLSRLTVWHYRMNFLLHQVFPVYIKHHIQSVLTCIWLIGFLRSWGWCYLPRQDFWVRLETSVCMMCFHLSFKGVSVCI